MESFWHSNSFPEKWVQIMCRQKCIGAEQGSWLSWPCGAETNSVKKPTERRVWGGEAINNALMCFVVAGNINQIVQKFEMSCVSCKQEIKRHNCLRFTKWNPLMRMVSVEQKRRMVIIQEIVRWVQSIFMIFGGYCLGIYFQKNGKEAFNRGREWLKMT